jgi:hypothetical protein
MQSHAVTAFAELGKGRRAYSVFAVEATVFANMFS